eukprot:TRINITY_DN20949_c0_g1_i1.p1 TRINITY_DN20949_c0_g1~~TRINITY_DN20949_c0_g1_i1.p1  ORF type:complete len:655 (+),score=176.74 TRINITY_DN20949_c0_g1_i1:67-2031(+)
MKVVGLVSGGKDSLCSLAKCVKYGHEVVCVANLAPEDPKEEELDSFCFQTVGHTHIDHIATALGLPLVKGAIRRDTSNVQTLEYPALASNIKDEGDEVERLYDLLREVKARFPEVNAVCSGAILSNYQRLRVESVCSRLGLVSLSYLWQRDQDTYVAELVDEAFDVKLIKIASMGLTRRHLGQSLSELQDYLMSLDYCHSAGEGGEYESLVVDCPLFKTQRLELTDAVIVDISKDKFAPVAHMEFATALVDKEDPPVPITRAPLPPPQHSFRDTAGICVGGDAALLASAASHASVWQSQCGLWGIAVAAADAAAQDAVAEAANAMLHQNPTLPATVYVHVYAQDIGTFAAVNKGYNPNFDVNPPSRAFVEVQGLPHAVAADMLTYHGAQHTRSTLHVQSISEWAPACIGPYAQCTTLGSTLLHAGMLGFDAPTMTLVGPGEAESTAMASDPAALREACVRLQSAKALEENYPPVMDVVGSSMGQVGLGVAYVTAVVDITAAADEWVKYFTKLGTAVPPLVITTATALPRCAAFELQLMSAKASAPTPRSAVTQTEGGVLSVTRFENMAYAVCSPMALSSAVEALEAACYEVGHVKIFADPAGLERALDGVPATVPVTVLPCRGAAVVAGAAVGDVGSVAVVWASSSEPVPEAEA